MLLHEGADAFGLRAAFFGRHRRREIAHHLRIGVKRGEGRQIVVARRSRSLSLSRVRMVDMMHSLQ